MGVPGFFAWILKNFKKKILIKNLSRTVEYFYVDANCLFHPECFKIMEYFKDETNVENLENKMFERIINYLDYLEKTVNPTKMMFISVDGSAPLAKILQQRKRRFKSIDDNKMRNDIKLRHGMKINDCWNNTVITPGTEFMEKLHNKLLNHYKLKSNDNIQYIYSSYHTEGEGEHKILQHIKQLTNNDDTVIYGLDADLIFLALASKRDNIYLLREASHFGTDKNIKKNELIDPISDVEQELIYVSIDETKKAYDEQISEIIYMRYKTNSKRSFTDDLIFICFLLGNDFIPHLRSVDIYNNGLDEIIDVYIECIFEINYPLITTNNGIVNINHIFFTQLCQKIMNKENKYFEIILPNKIKSNSYKKCYTHDKYSIDLWNFENLKNIRIHDPIRLGSGTSNDWKFRYYEYYFNVTEHQSEFIKTICHSYVEGISWVAKYYFEKCTDWRWQCPFDHAPFMSDIVEYLVNDLTDINNIKFKSNEPIPIMTQLLSVLPPACSNIIPKSYRYLVTNDKSPIIDMFPNEAELDMLYETYYWKCNPVLPYLDINRIMDSVHDIKMTTNENIRNKKLKNFVY